MVTVPAFVWRGGFLRRALIVGGAVGVPLAALAWIDSGILLAGIMVLVIVGLFYGSGCLAGWRGTGQAPSI